MLAGRLLLLLVVPGWALVVPVVASAVLAGTDVWSPGLAWALVVVVFVDVFDEHVFVLAVVAKLAFSLLKLEANLPVVGGVVGVAVLALLAGGALLLLIASTW